MSIFRCVLIALLFNSAAAMAAPASESSIRELFDVIHTRQSVDDKRSQFRAQADNFFQRSLKDKKLSPREQQALKNLNNKMANLFLENVTWEKLEPMVLRIYQDDFTEEEVVGMLTFYKTPVGQAVIVKMSQMDQRIKQEMQKITQEMAPQMRKIQLEFVAEMAVAKAEDAAAKTDETAKE